MHLELKMEDIIKSNHKKERTKMNFTFFKTSIGKVHVALAFFILFNLVSGYINLLVHRIPVLVQIHFFTGLLIIIAPLLMLLTIKNPTKILKAFLKMTFSFKSSFNKKLYMLGVAKLSASLSLIIVLISAITGIMMKFKLFSPKTAFGIHVMDFNLLLLLIPVHIVIMLILNMRKEKIKAA